jgi:hypothetical protein
VALIGLSVLVPCFSQNQEPLELFDGLYSGMTKADAIVRAREIVPSSVTSDDNYASFYIGQYEFVLYPQREFRVNLYRYTTYPFVSRSQVLYSRLEDPYPYSIVKIEKSPYLYCKLIFITDTLLAVYVYTLPVAFASHQELTSSLISQFGSHSRFPLDSYDVVDVYREGERYISHNHSSDPSRNVGTLTFTAAVSFNSVENLIDTARQAREAEEAARLEQIDSLKF